MRCAAGRSKGPLVKGRACCPRGTDIPPLDSSLHFLPPRRWNRSRPKAPRAGQSPSDILRGNPGGNTRVCSSCPRPGVCSPALCFLMSPLRDVLTSRADSEGTGHLSTCRSGEEGVGTRERSHLWMRGSPAWLGSRGGEGGGGSSDQDGGDTQAKFSRATERSHLRLLPCPSGAASMAHMAVASRLSPPHPLPVVPKPYP